MKPAKIREMTTDELQQQLEELQLERFRLRFRTATQALDNPMRIRQVRRDIARLKTVLTERQNQGSAR